MLMVVRQEFSHEICECEETCDIVDAARFWPCSHGLGLLRINSPNSIRNCKAEELDLLLCPSAFRKLELDLAFPCGTQKGLTMANVLLDQSIVAVLLVALGANADVVHEDAEELFAVGAPNATEGFVHEGLKYSWTLFRAHI